MTPILFDINEYSKLITNLYEPVVDEDGNYILVDDPVLQTEFDNLGIGTLTETISCKVIEERNGMFELEMQYPISGKHFNDLIISRIIVATPSYKKAPQPFRIYKITKPISGIITVYAEHISYRLSHIPVMPFTASNIQGALNGLKTNSAEINPFNFFTDVDTTGAFKNESPQSGRALLGGVEGSLLDVYGGEYEFDKYLVKLLKNRGTDRGVEIRYGKNLTDLTQEESIENTITGICPFWADNDGNVVTIPEKVVHSANAKNFPYNRTVVKDFSTEFDEAPTEAQLRSYARSYVEQTGVGVPNVSIKISFVHLAQFEEYKHLELLETVNLCDTVTVVFDELGVNTKAKVVKTDYDVLSDKYNSVSVGSIATNLVQTINDVQEATKSYAMSSALEQAKIQATQIMEAGGKGHVYFDYDEEHVIRQIMIMDSDDPLTATKRWVWNENGFGYETKQSDGKWLYDTAMTMDGAIVANRITTGTLRASNEDFVLDMQTGEVTIKKGKINIATSEQDEDKIELKYDYGGILYSTTYAPDGITLRYTVLGNEYIVKLKPLGYEIETPSFNANYLDNSVSITNKGSNNIQVTPTSIVMASLTGKQKIELGLNSIKYTNASGTSYSRNWENIARNT